ncbi:MAG: hypothetical protein M9915_12470 [Rhizobacter sp.]|nr:hypothetical protein [Rhizobacter sp.]
MIPAITGANDKTGRRPRANVRRAATNIRFTGGYARGPTATRSMPMSTARTRSNAGQYDERGLPDQRRLTAAPKRFNVASGAVLAYNLNPRASPGGPTEMRLERLRPQPAMLLSAPARPGDVDRQRHQGAASTTVAGDMTISGANDKNLSGGRVLNTEGTTAWSGSTATNNNRIRFTGATINNSGTWNDSNTSMPTPTTTRARTRSTGTYNKQGNTTTTMGVVYSTPATNVEAG